MEYKVWIETPTIIKSNKITSTINQQLSNLNTNQAVPIAVYDSINYKVLERTDFMPPI